MSLWIAAPIASAGTIFVDPSAPFDSDELVRAIEVRRVGGAGCAVIDVRMVRPDVVRVACDERAVLLGVGAARGDDAARAVALTLLALAEPEIEIPPWTVPPRAGREETKEGSDHPTVSWHVGLAGGGLFGAGAADRSLPLGRAALERRSGRVRVGVALDGLYRASTDAIPTMRALVTSLWVTAEIAGFELGPLASAGMVELATTTRGRFFVAAVGARAARRFALTRSMSLGVFGEPTVAIQRLEVRATGTGSRLASTPRLGLEIGVELTFAVAP